MDVITVHSYWTVLMFVAFVGICIWAFSGRRRAEFERHARIVLEDDETPTSGGNGNG